MSRASRVAKETTSRFFDNAGLGASSLTPRRSTRSSTRLAANSATATTTSSVKGEEDPDNKDEIIGFGSDIEDAVITRSSLSPRPNGAAVTRKRKRTTTTTATTTTTTRSVTEAGPSSSSRRTRTAASVAVKQETNMNMKMELDSDSDADIKDIKSDPSDEEKEKKPSQRRAARKPARKTTNPATGLTKIEPPTDWEEMYRLVKEMRLTGPAANAAVDTMGCERLASPDASPRDRRFHTLVALMLSSQTKDTVNAEAMIRLKNELPPYEEGKPWGLNLENMLAVEPAVLNELIGKVGFHNNKTKYLKQAAQIIRDQHNSDIPTTLEGLMSLPGVGPKMAHLCMGAEHGWNKVTGIGVDVHVHRITNLWGWQSPPSKTPEETRLALESWLPREKWKEINWLLVGFGQKVCLPVGRKCGDCALGLKGMCKAAERKKVIEGRRRAKMEVDEEVKVEKTEVVKVEDGGGGGADVKRVKKEEVEEEESKVTVKREEEESVMETTEVVDEEVPVDVKVKPVSVPVRVKKSEGEEDVDEELSFVKARVKSEGGERKVKGEEDDEKKAVDKTEDGTQDSSLVKIKIKEEDEEGDVKME